MQGWLKLRDAFPQSADEYTQPMERVLKRRREDTDEAWDKLKEGCAANSERMARVGLAPRTDDEGVIKLNVGGSNVTVCWQLLAEDEGFKDSILGALLEGVWGEGRIPRDADGRIVLDESPTCIKHIIAQTTLRASGRASSVVAVGLPERSAPLAVAADEVPCLIYTAHVMGLPGSMRIDHAKCMNVAGGSTILEPFEIAPFGAKIREWVGSSTEHMTLIYRATRDGFDTKSFKPGRCNENGSHTICLLRVSSGEGNDDDSVVGGYSPLPWGSGVASKQTITAHTFLFMLKDGSASGKNPSKPVKWDPYPNKVGERFSMNKRCGAGVGGSDLYTDLDAKTGSCIVGIGRKTFGIEEDSPFLALGGKDVVDIEVYQCSTIAPPKNTAPSTTGPGGDALTDAEAYDIRSFGETIASSLMEEKVVLDRAVTEMEAAGARVSASVGALEAVYGPSVAAGEQDAVVELNVRGTRMTSLRSTLQACPRSALATMFNEDRWPATDKDKDEHGRRLVDCNPTCFSKILDVLRMRKRASWNRGAAGGKQKEEKEEEEKGEEAVEEEEGGGGEEEEGGGGEEEEGGAGEEEEGEEEDEEGTNCGLGAVLIKRADAEAFGSAVNMYFPGCENFIMDLVQLV